MSSVETKTFDSINLEAIEKTIEHKEILYDLFCKRCEDFNISSNRQIDFTEHGLFVENHPYRVWFLIKFQNKYIGSVYLTTDNSVGVFLEKNQSFRLPELINIILSKFKPLPAIPSIRQAYFVINISPENDKYEKILRELCFPMIQKTFRLEKRGK